MKSEDDRLTKVLRTTLLQDAKDKKVRGSNVGVALGKRVLELQEETAKRYRADAEQEYRIAMAAADATKAKVEIEHLKNQETIKKRELKVEAIREEGLKAQHKRSQAAQEQWLQTEYSSQLFYQCKTYVLLLGRASKDSFF